jgi:hypothetical protein
VTPVAEPLVTAYARTRDRIVAVLETSSGDDLARVVPACPDWTVHQLLAHCVSLPAELSAGHRPTGDVGAWISELVAEREKLPVSSLVEEWQKLDAALDALLSGGAGLLFGDLAIHEHDFRGALGRPDHGALEVPEMLPREKVDAAIAGLPLPRYPTASDITNVVDFFASPRSSYVTAQTVYLGGVHG